MENFKVGDKVKVYNVDAHDEEYASNALPYFNKPCEIIAINANNTVCLHNGRIAFTVPTHWVEHVKQDIQPLYNGKVICTKFTPHSYYKSVAFTPGKVYKIENGVLHDDKPPCPYLHNITSLDYIRKSNYVDVDFIEFKGEA